jgi:putative sterol carrier protein
LNSDERYADIAKNWEGDLFFFIEPEGNLKERLTFYLDLWHGTCRKVEYKPLPESLSKSHLYLDRDLQQHHSPS